MISQASSRTLVLHKAVVGWHKKVIEQIKLQLNNFRRKSLRMFLLEFDYILACDHKLLLFNCCHLAWWWYIQGGPIKTVHFMRYHIFAANTDIIIIFVVEVFRNYSRKQQATTLFETNVKYSLQTSRNLIPCKCQCQQSNN